MGAQGGGAGPVGNAVSPGVVPSGVGNPFRPPEGQTAYEQSMPIPPGASPGGGKGGGAPGAAPPQTPGGYPIPGMNTTPAVGGGSMPMQQSPFAQAFANNFNPDFNYASQGFAPPPTMYHGSDLFPRSAQRPPPGARAPMPSTAAAPPGQPPGQMSALERERRRIAEDAMGE